jgi:anti-sigma regulatory factor (Ser/Thr protein kinase)
MQASAEGHRELRLSLASDSADIKRARDEVAELAADVGAPVRDVKLAVSEAVSNSIVHGFRDGRDGTISVVARVEGGRLVVSVADDGCGMKPNLESPGLGVGISLITSLATDVRFDSSPRGLTVSMSFDAPGAR